MDEIETPLRHTSAGVAPADNPFRASRIRPGAIPLFLPGGITLAAVADQLRCLDCQAQIIGPHGSGKSTLLRYLVIELRKKGRAVTTVNVQGRPSPAVWRRLWCNSGRPAVLLAVDGWEQLAWWQRCCLRWRQRGAGLLVTAHASIGLPTLWETAVSVALLRHVVNSLLATSSPSETARLPATLLRELISRHRKNLRELLFELFDTYQATGSPQASTDSNEQTPSNRRDREYRKNHR